MFCATGNGDDDEEDEEEEEAEEVEEAEEEEEAEGVSGKESEKSSFSIHFHVFISSSSINGGAPVKSKSDRLCRAISETDEVEYNCISVVPSPGTKPALDNSAFPKVRALI